MINKKILKSLISIGVTISIFLSAGSITSLATGHTEYFNLLKAKEESFEQYGKSWADSLTDDEDRSVIMQTGEDSYAMNYYLRSNKTELLPDPTMDRPYMSKSYLDNEIELIDSALAKATLPEDVIVYRGTDMHEFDGTNCFLEHAPSLDLSSLESIKSFEDYVQKSLANDQNKTYTSLAYTSTTKLCDFIFNPDIKMIIKIPKGTHAAYLKSISSYRWHEELLLPRNTKFEITGVSIIQEKVNRTFAFKEKWKNKLVINATVVE